MAMEPAMKSYIMRLADNPNRTKSLNHVCLCLFVHASIMVGKAYIQHCYKRCETNNTRLKNREARWGKCSWVSEVGTIYFRGNFCNLLLVESSDQELKIVQVRSSILG